MKSITVDELNVARALKLTWLTGNKYLYINANKQIVVVDAPESMWQRAGGVISPITETDILELLVGIESRSGKFGDIGKGDYIDISSAGNLRLLGAATVFDVLTVNANATKLAGKSDPGFDVFTGGLRTHFFDPTIDEEVFFNVQLPHKWKEGTDIYPHVHWLPDASAGEPSVVRWGLEYIWVNLGVTAGAATTIYTNVSAPAENFVGYRHYLSPFAAISGAGKTISSMLVCRLFRNASNVADTFSADAGLLHFDFHIEIDSLGSDEEYVKTV